MLQRCGDWIGALIDFPGFVEGEGEPYRPVALVWFEPGAQLIVDSELVKPKEALPRAAGLFHLATREPKAGKPRVPRRVRVADPALGAALRGMVGDVEIVVGPTPEIDEVLASMREFFLQRERGEEEGEASYLEAGVSTRAVATFFTAAAAFYSSAPWELIPPDEGLGIRCDALHIDDGVAVVVGQMGQAFGVSIYFSQDDANQMLDVADEVDRVGSVRGIEHELPRHIMVSFDADIEPSLRREVMQHGWKVAGPDAYPRAALIDSDLVARSLTTDELAGVTAILAAIAMLVEEHGDAVVEAFDGGLGVVQECEITVDGRPVNVGVTASIDLEEPGKPPLEWSSFRSLPEDALEEAVAIYCESVVEALGLSWDDKDANLLCSMIEAAADFYGTALLRLSPVQLRNLLTKTIPRKVPIAPADADRAFDLLLCAFDFAASRFVDDPGAANCLRVLTPAARKRFVAALADGSQHSGVKRLFSRARELGVDPRTPEGLERLVASFEGRAPKSRRTTKAPQRRKKPAAKPKPAKSPKARR